MNPTSLRDSALEYVSQGVPIFPVFGIDDQNRCTCGNAKCSRPGKHPMTANGFKDATTDRSQVEAWWKDSAKANIGMPTGEVSGIVVLDVDGQDGAETLATFESLGHVLPECRSVQTGRLAGKHVYFTYDRRIPKNGVNVLRGCDIRSNGGYVILPPSKHHSGSYYRWQDSELPPADVPDWLIDALTGNARVGEKTPHYQSYRKAHQECIPEGRRNDTVFRLAVKLAKGNATYDELNDAVAAFNASMCNPPLDVEEIATIVSSAWKRNGTNTELATEEVDQEDGSLMKPRIFSSVDSCMQFFDAHFYKAIIGGRVVVLTHGRDLSENLSKQDFCDAHSNKTIRPGPAARELEAARYWFKYTSRSYARVVFDPNPTYHPKSDELNIWTGFTVKPNSNGKAASYLAFVKEVICNNDVKTFDFLLDWMAHIVQRPQSKQGANISVAMRGMQGVGKSFFVERFGHLFGSSFVTINNIHSITGRFNTFLLNKIVVLGDEAIWGGDKANRDILKNLISSGSINIEQKFKDVFTVTNYCRFFFTTNSDWAAPVERGNRRYLVLDVSDRHRQDTAYFRKIAADLESGGYGDLLFRLMHRNYSTRDFEQSLPRTQAMMENQFNGMNSLEMWLYENLMENEHTLLDSAGTEIVSSTLYRSYSEWARNVATPSMPLGRFTSLVKVIFPSATFYRKQEHLVRGTVVLLPSVEILRKDFQEYVGLPLFATTSDVA